MWMLDAKRRDEMKTVESKEPLEESRFGSRLEDLAWIDEFIECVRPYVRARVEDGVLIKMPLETYSLNRTGVALLDRALRGEKIREIAHTCGALTHPDRLYKIHTFFCDVRDLLAGRLGDGRDRLATSISPFEGSFTRYPVLSEIAVTYRCNLSCRFCYAGCGGTCAREGGLLRGEMTTEEVCRIIDIIANDAKVPSVSFTGGEPTLREDLPALIERARERTMRVNLITNGVACAERKIADRLVASGLNSAQVSLEGPSARIHDGLTRRAGAFERTVKGIRNLKAAGLRVHTNTTLCEMNIGHVEGIIDLAMSLGLERISMNLVIPTEGAVDESGVSIQTTYDRIGPNVLRARDYAERVGLEFHWYSPTPYCIFNPIEKGLGCKGCAACDGLLHVAPWGEILPCSSFGCSEGVGNLLEEKFEEIWFGERAQHYKRKQMAHPLCRDCEYFALCQGACVLYWRRMGYTELFTACGRVAAGLRPNGKEA